MERGSIQYGMIVRGPGRERLGRVESCGRDHFLVRAGIPRRRYAIAYDDVVDLAHGVVHLRRGREARLSVEEARGDGPMLSVMPLHPQAKTVREGVPA